MSPAQQSIFKRVCVCARCHYAMCSEEVWDVVCMHVCVTYLYINLNINLKGTWFGHIVYLNRNYTRQNYSCAEMYPFSCTSTS